MIQSKLKMCAGCNAPKHIWKSHGKDKYCKECWYNIEKPKSISPMSKKMKEKVDDYTKLRTAFLVIHPHCEAKLNNCTIKATDVHHCFSGANKEKYFLKISTWKAVCRSCHNFIHNNLSMEEAIELGLKCIE